MRQHLRLNRSTRAIVDDIKKTMHVNVPPHGLTVFQALSEKEREKAFNQTAADEFPKIRRQFTRAIREHLTTAGKKRISARQVQNIARSAWKEDAAAVRRVREMQKRPPDQFRSPYRGQPERYDPEVVLAFENAIASAIRRPRISWTRGTNDNKSSGAILAVFVAAVQWATCVAWLCSAPPGTIPVKVKAEGLLRIVKDARRRNDRLNTL
jgi:hypothetical protein